MAPSLHQRIAGRIRGRGQLPRLRSQIHELELPLAGDPEAGWRPHHLFRGSTGVVGTLGFHVSVLEPGHSPHPPHRHADEELLTVLDGEAELVVEDAASPGGLACHTVTRGTFAYYPSGFAHTIYNGSAAPVTYAMLKWTSWTGKRGDTLGHRLVPFGRRGGEAVTMEQLLAGRTRWLGNLRVHSTTMLPGGGYAEHADGYDVALIVLQGTVETLGRRIGPNSAVFYARGELHGMRNPGSEPAFYLVVELRPRRPQLQAQVRRLKTLRQRLAPAG